MIKLLSILVLTALTSCQQKIKVDSVVINANVYTVNSSFDKAEAFAIKDSKFIEVGNSKDIQEKYTSDNLIDAKGQTIVPGFIDAHCHFLALGFNSQQVDLVGTTSFEEIINKIIEYTKTHPSEYIRGSGWDQNDWDIKEFPNKAKLDSLFPNTPVLLKRIDGHACLVNQSALDLGNVTIDSKVEGGELVIEDGKLTGVLIDRAQQLVTKYWPKPTRNDVVNALLKAQDICFGYGLTTVNDAGLDKGVIEIIDSLQQTGDLKMRVYAMVSGTPNNVDYYLNKGIIKTDKLDVRSFKFYADGALGSRGALLRKSYSDKPNHFGLQLTDLKTFDTYAKRIANSEYQMNTHAIGDSANHAVLRIYKNALEGKKDRRWKIEHAQVISPEDFELFDDIIPSVQPTHATSDMYWAEDRLGHERIKGAYAYKDLLNHYGKVALGTDFPVEQVSPFLTFYAAVARQDVKGYPKDGFQMENSLSREETLKGMTIWAAYSNFEEGEKGSIEAGKFADFIILDKNIMEVPVKEIPEMKTLQTFVGGESVFN
ncbi:amidohydrolase [Yeosuana marina]|uniref:amidohydrolase n=1 Tax=Yeosuana marina TaxID=1565536 RepID=UPI00141E6734|nr:amidohydrolase [Yeosuana marina]